MKVAKKVKLLTKDKDGLYNVKGQHSVLRDRAVIGEADVKKYQDECKETGILYIVDEEATKERNELVNPKKPKK